MAAPSCESNLISRLIFSDIYDDDIAESTISMRHASTICTRSDNISTWPGSVLGLGIWGGQRDDHDSSREGLCVGMLVSCTVY